MKPDGPIKLISQLLDLPIIDSEGNRCGIVDDIELTGGAREPLEVKAIMVGPGAYAGRLPRWCTRIVRMIAGNRIVRVPFSKIRTIGPCVRLQVPGTAVGLRRSENRVARWIPRKGAL